MTPPRLCDLVSHQQPPSPSSPASSRMHLPPPAPLLSPSAGDSFPFPTLPPLSWQPLFPAHCGPKRQQDPRAGRKSPQHLLSAEEEGCRPQPSLAARWPLALPSSVPSDDDMARATTVACLQTSSCPAPPRGTLAFPSWLASPPVTPAWPLCPRRSW